MSNILKFKVSDDEAEVVLEVDMTVLTPELATMINNFWSGATTRLKNQDDDVVITVVRLFGAVAIRHMLEEGGAHFSINSHGQSKYWTEKVLELEYEGWPSAEGLGICIVEACVDVPDYLSVDLLELDVGGAV